MYTAAIFDMDGVIVDSIKPDFHAWERIFADYNKTITFDTYKEFSGMRGAEIVMRYLDVPEEQAEAAEQQKETYFLENAQEIKTVSGLRTFLKQLEEQNVKTAVATAANKEKATAVLSLLDLSFQTVITSEDTARGKPDPAPFLLAAKKLDAKPEECIVFEDAPNGIQAALAGNMTPVALTTTHNENELVGAKKIVASFDQLTWPPL